MSRTALGHPRLVALGAVLVLLLAGFGVALLRSRPATSCAVAAAVPDLPAQLRVLGGFDQPIDGGDPRQLEDLAQQAASAVAPTLGAVVPVQPVAERSLDPGSTDAVVVPLVGSARSSGGAARVEGLVSFLRDCGGHLHFGQVADLVRSGSGGQLPRSYPAVAAAAALSSLGAASVELVYRASPFTPLWRDPVSGRTTPAT